MIKWMDKIIHFDELNPEDVIYVNNKLATNKNYEISEKVDGENFSFGIKDNKFFSKTKKSKPIFDPIFYDKIDFMVKFRKIHNILNSSIFLQTMKPYGDIQFFGELVYEPHTNNIKYDKIKTPAIILLFYYHEEIKKQFDDNLYEIIIKLFAGQGVNIYKKNNYTLDPNSLLTQTFVKSQFELMYDNWKDLLKSRKKANKKRKEEIKSQLKEYQIIQKKFYLKHFFTSKRFPSNYTSSIPEGYIFMDNNIMVKFVNKEKFFKLNKQNHDISSQLKKNKLKFKKEVVKTLFNNADILLNSTKLNQKLEENFMGWESINEINEMFIFQTILCDLDEERNVTYPIGKTIKKYNEIRRKYLYKAQKIGTDWYNLDKTNISNHVQNVIQSQLERQYNQLEFETKYWDDIFNIIVNKNKIYDKFQSKKRKEGTI